MERGLQTLKLGLLELELEVPEKADVRDAGMQDRDRKNGFLDRDWSWV